MLALIASSFSTHRDEPLDRDPGIVTLAATILRALRRGHADAFRRRCDLVKRTARPF